MEKILVIDDTPENLQAAKLFFSTILGYEFIFCSNREEAEVELPNSFAVITDQNFPYNSQVITKEGGSRFYMCAPFNGYYIVGKSKLLDKPVIMVSNHGNLYGLGKVLSSFSKTVFLSLENLLLENPGDDTVEEMYTFLMNDIKIIWDSSGNKSKANTTGWETAWNELQKQF